jgi:hypothetical protein
MIHITACLKGAAFVVMKRAATPRGLLTEPPAL